MSTARSGRMPSASPTSCEGRTLSGSVTPARRGAPRPAPSMVMPGLVPGTHAGPRHCGVSDRAGTVRGAVRLGAAWVAGTSPAMTKWRVGSDADPPWPPSPISSTLSTVMPGLVPGTHAGPRQRGSSDRAGTVRGAVRRRAAWVAGTSPAMTRRRAGIDSDPPWPPSPLSLRPLHGHARACPGHQRRPAPARVLGPGRDRPGRGAAPRGVGGRDKPGHDGTEGMDRFGSAVASLTALSAPSMVMPGLVPGTHAGPRQRGVSDRGPAGAPRGSARRGWPGRARP